MNSGKTPVNWDQPFEPGPIKIEDIKFDPNVLATGWTPLGRLWLKAGCPSGSAYKKFLDEV